MGIQEIHKEEKTKYMVVLKFVEGDSVLKYNTIHRRGEIKKNKRYVSVDDHDD